MLTAIAATTDFAATQLAATTLAVSLLPGTGSLRLTAAGSGDQFVPPPPIGNSGGSGTGDAARIQGRILIVDDNSLVIRALSRGIRSALNVDSTQVLTADGVDAALQVFDDQAASSDPVVAILSDMDMPEKDAGLRLLAEVRQRGFTGPFIIQSGRVFESSEEAQAVIKRDPLVGYFDKPWDLTAMAAWLRQALVPAVS